MLARDAGNFIFSSECPDQTLVRLVAYVAVVSPLKAPIRHVKNERENKQKSYFTFHAFAHPPRSQSRGNDWLRKPAKDEQLRIGWQKFPAEEASPALQMRRQTAL